MHSTFVVNNFHADYSTDQQFIQRHRTHPVTEQMQTQGIQCQFVNGHTFVAINLDADFGAIRQPHVTNGQWP